MTANQPRGSVSAMVVCLVATFALLAGLAFDGGRVVNSYVRLSDVAENAARIGAQNIVGIRAGNPRIDSRKATVAMDEFLNGLSLSGRYAFSETSVSVEVTERLAMTALKAIGVLHRRIHVVRVVTIVGG